MRPVQLELVGFTAFRNRTEIDFRDSDLFALTGPTGSGKSSIIDAIVFALYGAVPRYGDRRTVEPVISLGKVEAKIRFDFTIGDTAYTAVRVVRRLKKGATTAEARLEHEGSVLASGADEVTSSVEQLLGLSYEHFVKAVVLPQGEFSRFLHDRPSKRQELLRELLDIGVYRDIRDLANQRKSAAEASLVLVGGELESLAHATESAEIAATERLAELQSLRGEADAVFGEATMLATEAEKLKAGLDVLTAQRQQVLSVHTPSGVTDLAKRLADADEAREKARGRASAAREQVLVHEKAIAEMPDLSELEQRVRTFGEHRQAAERTAALLDQQQAAQIAYDAQQRLADDALARLTTAREERDEIRRLHAAHELVGTLQVGEPCPVCQATVRLVPDTVPVPVLDVADAQVAELTRHATDATAQAMETKGALAALSSQCEDAERALSALNGALEGDEAEIGSQIAAARLARRTLGELQQAERTAGEKAESADTLRTNLVQEERTAWEAFDSARDLIAALGPPPARRSDLAEDWRALNEWATKTSGELESKIGETDGRLRSSRQGREHILTDLAKRLESAGLDSRDPRPDGVISAVARAEGALQQLRADRTRADQLGLDVARHKEHGVVAGALVNHLNARKFEAWLLEEALVALTIGANRLLDELSSGAYSLETAKNEFLVVDHRNADQRRSVRTLSGGETFLVSLALALSLSEQLTTMSMYGTSKLESIFLDEGFGTLDQETLDVVASVVHELGASGRTVGLVSHVADLAEQVPTRYVVTKDVNGAHVERIDG